MTASEEYARYVRHYSLSEIGVIGQKKLKEASVLIIGAGGLGCPASLYLAAAGIGRLGIVDHDHVELSNLQRQITYRTADHKKSKAQASVEHLSALNPYIKLDKYEEKFNKNNALELVSGYKYIVDCTDNFPTRYLINDTCVGANIPYIYAAIFRFEGQATVFAHKDGPCYRCLYPEPPPPELIPNCAEAGVLGVLPGLLGTIQATETLKLILGIGQPLINELLIVDSLTMGFQKLHINKNPECASCGSHPAPKTICSTDEPCPEMSMDEWRSQQSKGHQPFLLDVRERHEFSAKNMGGHLIPLGELSQRMPELLPHKLSQIIVHCQSGARSKRAVLMLRAQGFNAVNLKGGILSWT